MVVRISWRGNGLAVSGLGALVLLLAIPALLRVTPDPDALRAELRQHFAWQVAQVHVGAASGGRVLDFRAAQRTDEALERVKRVEIVSMELARPLPDLLSVRRSVVARVVLHDPERGPETRYYWFLRASVVETSRWLWWISW